MAAGTIRDHAKVLVTGADGFVGKHLVPYLAAQGFQVTAACRRPFTFDSTNVITVPLPDLSVPFDWHTLLGNCDTVVHLAGIAHKFSNDDIYDKVNHLATAALARALLDRGKERLVFVSSIAAQSGSYSNRTLREGDDPRPNNAYGRSKLAAEHAIRATGVSFTILRPVAIYGDGEKGNFSTIHKVSNLPLPLPFGALTAQRSVLSIQNFNSAVKAVLTSQCARNETYIVSDPTPVTLADLIARYRAERGRPAWLMPIPEKWLELIFKAAGQRSIWERFGRPLVADPTKLIAAGWRPSDPSSIYSGPLQKPPGKRVTA